MFFFLTCTIYCFELTGKFTKTALLATDEEANTSSIPATVSVHQQPGHGRNVNRYNLV